MTINADGDASLIVRSFLIAAIRHPGQFNWPGCFFEDFILAFKKVNQRPSSGLTPRRISPLIQHLLKVTLWRYMKKSLLILLITLGCWPGMSHSNSTFAHVSNLNPNRIVVNQLISPSWPVQVKTAVITQLGKRQLLTCTVTNPGTQTVQNIELLLSAYFPDGSPHSVSLWQQPVTLAPGQSLDFTHQIGSIEDPDTATDPDDENKIRIDLQDKVVLSITNVKTDSGGWKTDQHQSLRLLNRFAMGEFIQPLEPEKY